VIGRARCEAPPFPPPLFLLEKRNSLDRRYVSETLHLYVSSTTATISVSLSPPFHLYTAFRYFGEPSNVASLLIPRKQNSGAAFSAPQAMNLHSQNVAGFLNGLLVKCFVAEIDVMRPSFELAAEEKDHSFSSSPFLSGESTFEVSEKLRMKPFPFFPLKERLASRESFFFPLL